MAKVKLVSISAQIFPQAPFLHPSLQIVRCVSSGFVIFSYRHIPGNPEANLNDEEQVLLLLNVSLDLVSGIVFVDWA